MGFVYPFKHHLEGLKNHFFGKKRVVGAESSKLLKNIFVLA